MQQWPSTLFNNIVKSYVFKVKHTNMESDIIASLDNMK